jgi:type 1 glutamine amidotransferase
MSRRLFATLFVLSAALVSAQPKPAGPPKIQTLIIAGQNRHNWIATTPILRKALEDTGRFEVRVVEEFRGAGPETLAPYDLVVLNYDNKNQDALRWGARADSALLDFVSSGKGVVVFHFAVAAFVGWDDFERLASGTWRPNNGHHSAAHDFTVKIKDSDHPITRGLKLEFPQPKDELYANLKWHPGSKHKVLATAWDDHALYGGKARQPIPGPGLDQPMLWVQDWGKGRVFTTVLGHDAPQVSTPAFVVTFARGAEWAATGKVTLPIPAEMAK